MKRAYQTPVVRKFGTVSELTRNGVLQNADVQGVPDSAECPVCPS